MPTIVVTEKVKNYPILDLGKATEYGYKIFKFVLSSYVNDYGEPTNVEALFTPCGGKSYILASTWEDGILSVPITSSETIVGTHTISLNIYLTNGHIVPVEFRAKCSDIAQTTELDDTPPEVVTWLDQVNAKIIELDKWIKEAKEYLEKLKTSGESGSGGTTEDESDDISIADSGDGNLVLTGDGIIDSGDRNLIIPDKWITDSGDGNLIIKEAA